MDLKNPRASALGMLVKVGSFGLEDGKGSGDGDRLGGFGG